MPLYIILSINRSNFLFITVSIFYLFLTIILYFG
nr:MAG TPA: hypothetical protein [Bacteriophage sp.]